MAAKLIDKNNKMGIYFSGNQFIDNRFEGNDI